MQGPMDVFNDQESTVVKIIIVLVYLFFLPLTVLWFIVAYFMGDEA